jgi:Protein of unknown function (DUF3435)
MIRYDIQAAYRGTASQIEWIRVANRMSQLMDPRRPKKLSDEQKGAIRSEPEIRRLRSKKDGLFRRIREKYAFVYKAKDDSIYEEYQKAKLSTHDAIRSRERAVLAEVRKQYDQIAPLKDMHDQINGDAKDQSVLAKKDPIRYSLPERRRIAEEFIRSRSSMPDISRKISIVEDFISLCRRQERGVLKASRKRMRRLSDSEAAGRDTPPLSHSVKTDSSESGANDSVQFPSKCKPFQCLTCLGDRGKPLPDRVHNYRTKFSMQRHVTTSHKLRPRVCPHPDPACAKVVIKSTTHYKHHVAAVHGIELGEKVWSDVP